MGFGDWLRNTFFTSSKSNKNETSIDVFQYYIIEIVKACNNPKYIYNAEINLMALKHHVETSIKQENKRKKIFGFLAAVGTSIANIKEKKKNHPAGIPYAFSRDIVMDINNSKRKHEIQESEYSRGRNEKLDITSVSMNLARAKELFIRSL